MLSEHIFSDRTYCFLAGAGVSFDSPSNLPLARDMVYKIVEVLSIEESLKVDIKGQFDRGNLRFEQFMELISEIFDRDLQVLNHLSKCDSPNLLHNLLAEIANNDHHIFTTNFDCLIETACTQKRIPVQTVFSNEQKCRTNTKIVWKLHGSLQDEQGLDTRKSIVATITRLGQKGESFSNDPFLKEIFFDRIQHQDLIILGYSGSDDYDIVPMISQIKSRHKIFWVFHDTQISPFKVFDFATFKKERKIIPDAIYKILSQGNWKEEQLYIIVGRTSEVLSAIHNILIKNSGSDHYEIEYKIPSHYYLHWSFKHALEEWRNLSFAGKYFLLAGNYGEAQSYFQLALSQSEETKELSPKIYVLFCLSRTCIKDNRPKEALAYLETIYSIPNGGQKSRYFQLEQKILKSVGRDMVEYEQQLAICHSELGNFESALAILHKAECQKDTIEYARGLYEEARVMRKMGNFPKALSLVEESVGIHRKYGNLESLSICLPFLLDLLIEKKDFSEVKERIPELIGICKITNNEKLMSECRQLSEQIKSY